jgi:hypothetical protein
MHATTGQVDPMNEPHVGGNTWAGGTGGRDTAGLGGKGGPYRLVIVIFDCPHVLHVHLSGYVAAGCRLCLFFLFFLQATPVYSLICRLNVCGQDSGNDVHQLSDEEKRAIPDHVRQAAA